MQPRGSFSEGGSGHSTAGPAWSLRANYTSQPALRLGQRPTLAREPPRISNLQLPSLARGRAAPAVAIAVVVLVQVVAAETAAAILVRPRKRRRRRRFAGATVSFFPPTVRTFVV